MNGSAVGLVGSAHRLPSVQNINATYLHLQHGCRVRHATSSESPGCQCCLTYFNPQPSQSIFVHRSSVSRHVDSLHARAAVRTTAAPNSLGRRFRDCGTILLGSRVAPESSSAAKCRGRLFDAGRYGPSRSLCGDGGVTAPVPVDAACIAARGTAAFGTTGTTPSCNGCTQTSKQFPGSTLHRCAGKRSGRQ